MKAVGYEGLEVSIKITKHETEHGNKKWKAEGGWLKCYEEEVDQKYLLTINDHSYQHKQGLSR